jgi:hypothetical protein
MLKEFDLIRHGAVHHEGSALLEYNLKEFTMQLKRAVMIWICHICLAMGLKFTAEDFFGVKRPA